MSRISRGPIQKSLKYIPDMRKGVKARSRMLAVPHKHPANDTFEPFWKFGRYVCQLKRLTINYCPNHPSSRGIRYTTILYLRFKILFYLGKICIMLYIEFGKKHISFIFIFIFI